MALTKSERSLFDAVTKGNLKQVKTLLKKVTDPDFEGDYGRTPLEQAIFHGHLPVVKALIEAGAELNRINDYNQTPLDYARAYSETKIATFLKDEGGLKAAEANKRNSYNSPYDDDFYFGRGFDDDDDWNTPKKSAAKKSRAAKTSASRAANGKFSTSALDDEGGGTAEKANQPVKPKFDEQTLKDVFNAKKWVGKTEEMQKLWKEVPVKLQKKYDFDTALAEAKRETLRKNAPQAPSLKLNGQPPQQTPPAPSAPDKQQPPAQ